MRKGVFCRIVLILLVSFVNDRVVLADSAPKSSDRPNIIVIFTDDQTYRTVGYNSPMIKTPLLIAFERQVEDF